MPIAVALQLMQTLGEATKEGGDGGAETVAAIDAYMSGNEKGATKRRELLAAAQAETAAARRARPLHRLRWHPRRPWVAACGDQTAVEVYSAEQKLRQL